MILANASMSLMDRKLMDFPVGEASAELWGDLTTLRTVFVEGIAHADCEEGIVRLTLYNSSGLKGVSGEMKLAAVRLIVSAEGIRRLAGQLEEVANVYGPAASQLPTSVSAPQVAPEPPSEVIGPRIA
jgi:hypothetical protein